MAVAEALAKDVGIRPATRGLAISRASYYRWKDKCDKPEKKYTPPLSLSLKEREQVLDILHGRQYVDMAPQEVYHALLDSGTYLCSVRTMYRLLEAHSEVRERRDQLCHPSYIKPELLAEAPNQVWSWDITKLRRACKVDLLLSLRDNRYIQPLCCRLDGSLKGERVPGKEAYPAIGPKAGNRAKAACHSF